MLIFIVFGCGEKQVKNSDQEASGLNLASHSLEAVESCNNLPVLGINFHVVRILSRKSLQ